MNIDKELRIASSEATLLEEENIQLKKELYDLREAVWSLRDFAPAETVAGVDRLMGDWTPDHWPEED